MPGLCPSGIRRPWGWPSGESTLGLLCPAKDWLQGSGLSGAPPRPISPSRQGQLLWGRVQGPSPVSSGTASASHPHRPHRTHLPWWPVSPGPQTCKPSGAAQMPHKGPQIVQPLQNRSSVLSPASQGPDLEPRTPSFPSLAGHQMFLGSHASSCPLTPPTAHGPFQVLASLLDCSQASQVQFSGPQTPRL